jgi:Tfp pilus assembly protein FimV
MPGTSPSAKGSCRLRAERQRIEGSTMDQTAQPSIHEKAPKPAGLLPKNVQSWLLVGVAFLMLAIMWLTGGKKPPTPTKAGPGAATMQAPVEVNEAKIAEMQNRIQDLQHQQLLAQTALAQQTRQLASPRTRFPRDSTNGGWRR